MSNGLTEKELEQLKVLAAQDDISLDDYTFQLDEYLITKRKLYYSELKELDSYRLLPYAIELKSRVGTIGTFPEENSELKAAEADVGRVLVVEDLNVHVNPTGLFFNSENIHLSKHNRNTAMFLRRTNDIRQLTSDRKRFYNHIYIDYLSYASFFKMDENDKMATTKESAFYQGALLAYQSRNGIEPTLVQLVKSPPENQNREP